MPRRLAMMVAAGAIGLSVLSFNPSVAQAECEKIRGTITCTETKRVGNAPANSKAQTTTTTTTKKGSVNSSHPQGTKCTGPRGQCK